MSQQSSLTQSAHSVRQVLTAYTRARGVKLGNPALAVANRAAAFERAEALRPILAELSELSATAAAAELNARAVATPTGAKWSALTVIRVRQRLAHAR